MDLNTENIDTFFTYTSRHKLFVYTNVGTGRESNPRVDSEGRVETD